MFKSGTSKKELEQLSSSSTIIAQGVVLEGNMETSGNLRIEGKVVGNVRSKSKVAMGSSSMIEGNLLAQNAEIAGLVRGVVEVSDLLILKSSAVIEGDIVTGKIMVENGAIFNGKCKMGADVKEINLGERTRKKEAQTA
ncbi:MAG: polymer-forming cytoskeletal protein [Cytophagaceae bacterium]|nr:polymer-forming cytoskeletal protein [Cytophagaceae bacterium]MDW8456682.1 polymer-forming cytoskeletal protein [Cytophagaceae bacterium]